MVKKPREVIGWREWLALPDLRIKRIKAKVDTGARSSSLHAFDIKISENGDGSIVRFSVHPVQRESRTTVRCKATLHEERWVKSSNGERELRPVVRTVVRLGGETWPIDLTLTSRDVMGFRMLLGREAIRGRFHVDPGRSFLDAKLVARVGRKK